VGNTPVAYKARRLMRTLACKMLGGVSATLVYHKQLIGNDFMFGKVGYSHLLCGSYADPLTRTTV
jgi:hypothetical protein